MDRSYVAFISYRHRPLDAVVARRLHAMIEQYRVPRALRRGGSDRLGVVFRDREELSVSSDLSAEIREALDNSSHLIVICTPDTPGSPWVAREIERFLERHPRENVLAVLAAGAPEESFPPQLTRSAAADGAGRPDRVEPLAANVVGRSRRAVLKNLRAEKLRLIAGILGCPYDELRQRERARARRRAAAAGALAACVALAFIGVLWRGNVQMRRKNAELRASEAQALANLAEARLREDDLYGAISNGVASLRLGGENASAAALAEQVLCDALNPYAVGEAYTEAILRQETEIEDLLVCGARICTIDAEGCVRAFDAGGGAPAWESRRLGAAIRPSGQSPRLYGLEGGALLAKYGDELRALDGATGATRWSFALESSELCDYAALSEDRSTLAVAERDLRADELRLRFLDAGSGRELGAVRWPAGEFGFDSADSRDKVVIGTFTHSGARFVGCGYAPVEGADGAARTAIRFFTVDLSDWTVRDFYVEDALYRANSRVDSARTHVLGMALDATDAVLSVAACNDAEGIVLLERVRLADGEVLSREGADWVEQPVALMDAPFELEAHAGFFHTDSLNVVQLGSHLYLFDGEGRYLSDCDTWGEDALELCGYAYDNSFALIGDGGTYGLGVVLENGRQLWSRALQLGEIRLARTGLGGCLALPEAMEGRETARLLEDDYVELTDAGFVAVVPKNRGNQVRVVRPRLELDADGALPALAEAAEGRAPFALGGGRLAVAGEGTIALLDADGAPALELATGGSGAAAGNCRLTSDGSYLLYPDVDGDAARRDLAAGGSEKLCEDFDGAGAMPALAHSDPEGGAIVSGYMNPYDFPLRAYWWLDGAAQELTVCPFSPAEFCPVSDLLVSGRGLLTEYDEASAGQPCFAWFAAEDRSWRRVENPYNASIEHVRCLGRREALLASLGDDGRLRVWDLDSGALVRELDAQLGGRTAVQLCFADGDRLLVMLTADGCACVYDLEAEARVYAQQTEISFTRYTAVQAQADAARGRLFLSLNARVGLCVDMASWTRVATIPNLLFYLPEQNLLVVRVAGGGVCAVPARSAQELIALAEDPDS